MSPLCPVQHGDVVVVGSTTLDLHIHLGSDTCDNCEPGLVQAAIKAKEEEENKGIVKANQTSCRQSKKSFHNDFFVLLPPSQFFVWYIPVALVCLFVY